MSLDLQLQAFSSDYNLALRFACIIFQSDQSQSQASYNTLDDALLQKKLFKFWWSMVLHGFCGQNESLWKIENTSLM